jgi:hypothetical protein
LNGRVTGDGGCEEYRDSPNSSSKHSDDIFSSDERSARLKKLLQSKNPHDLQEANKLIKRIVSEVTS